jgi:hypothetical protein
MLTGQEISNSSEAVTEQTVKLACANQTRGCPEGSKKVWIPIRLLEVSVPGA